MLIKKKFHDFNFDILFEVFISLIVNSIFKKNFYIIILINLQAIIILINLH